MRIAQGGIRDLLVRGKAAAKAGDMEEARFYLRWVLRSEGLTEERKIEALFWLSESLDDPVEKRDCLETILAYKPYHPQARRKLAILDGKLSPDEIVNPEKFGPAIDRGPSLCPECGGALVFSADGDSRHCERCGWEPGDALLLTEEPAELLKRGIAALKAGERREAARCLETVTRQAAATAAEQISAWLWLSGVRQGVAETRACLESVLRLDPENYIATRGLAQLESAPVSTPEPELETVTPRRFTCPQCGGKMAFDAAGQQLRCTYCGYEQHLLAARRSDDRVDEQDFTLALATAKGHTRPEKTQAFQCQGCRASFILAPGVLSLECPYCGSAHVVQRPDRELIPPEAILPFAVEQQEAQRYFLQWLKEKKLLEEALITVPHGLYLPVWTFDVGGSLAWNGVLIQADRHGGRRIPQSGEYFLDEDDLLVPASHTLPADLLEIMKTFETVELEPYAPSFLADWPAEIYEIAVSDASLAARQQTLEKHRLSVQRQLCPNSLSGEKIHDLRISSRNIAIYAYKLVLLPVWVARYRHEGQHYRVVINGRTGEVRGQQPLNWFRKLLKGVL